MKVVDVILVCDADPDRERFGAPACDENGPLEWKGVEFGVPKLLEGLKLFHDDDGVQPKFSWLIRSDRQIASLMGHEDGAYVQYQDIWERCRSRGDELGWHPHYWRWKRGCWQQESEDLQWQEQTLRRAHAALAQRFEIKTVKMGWCFMNLATMDTLRALGVSCDVSGMPMQYYRPADVGGQPRYGAYDWRRTGHDPYWASRGDYQCGSSIEPGTKGLIELPVTVGHSVTVSALESFVLAFRRRQWPQRRLGQEWTSLKVTFNRFLFKTLLAGAMPSILSMDRPFLHCYFHPDELLPERGQWAKAYGLRHVKSNMELLLRSFRLRGYRLRFSTVDEFCGRLKKVRD
jgi:hypothetical protein